MERGRRTTTPAWMRTGTRETAYIPGGLQQLSIGARQEENRTPAIVTIRPAGTLPPVGCGRWTTTPAWMSTGTGGAVPATGGLQEQQLIGEQHEGLRPLTMDSTDPAAVTPSVGSGRRTTTPAWMRTGTRGTAYAPGGLQQQMSIGARQEENRTTAIITIRPAGALPPLGRGIRTATSAWMSTGTGGTALATDGLQPQELSGVQRGEGMPSATCLLYTSPSPRD